ncbi:MAG TPA: hypothetical protein VFX96_20595, partial [Pyrinomonadaceae bacterium]|nr:hypothetical protein [Pyrinomonadaceae bacterium]
MRFEIRDFNFEISVSNALIRFGNPKAGEENTRMKGSQRRRVFGATALALVVLAFAHIPAGA